MRNIIIWAIAILAVLSVVVLGFAFLCEYMTPIVNRVGAMGGYWHSVQALGIAFGSVCCLGGVIIAIILTASKLTEDI